MNVCWSANRTDQWQSRRRRPPARPHAATSPHRPGGRAPPGRVLPTGPIDRALRVGYHGAAMSITETDKVDIVAARPDSSIVRLVISDHLAWDDLETHSRLLQHKVNTYLEFIESGKLAALQKPRIPDDPEYRIALELMHAPSREGQELLEQVRAFLGTAGIALDVNVR
jgi:hypothetical protein